MRPTMLAAASLLTALAALAQPAAATHDVPGCTVDYATASVGPTGAFASAQLRDSSDFLAESADPTGDFVTDTLEYGSDLLGGNYVPGTLDYAGDAVVYAGRQTPPTLDYAGDTAGNAGAYSGAMLPLTTAYASCALA